MSLFSALVLGFFGSLHCVGMCGPISIAVSGTKKRQQFWQRRVLYNLGRTMSYVLMGAIVGTFGYSLVLAGAQQGISLVLGIAWLLLLLCLPHWESYILKTALTRKLLLQVKTRLSTLLKEDRLPLMFNAGIVNGFLPCGLVYLALSGALASGNMLSAMTFMFLFGLGTFPAMLAVSFLSSTRKNILPFIKPVLHILSIAFAILLILRGLNLGIPYVSPELVSDKLSPLICQ